jgi:hypothetical protein
VLLSKSRGELRVKKKKKKKKRKKRHNFDESFFDSSILHKSNRKVYIYADRIKMRPDYFCISKHVASKYELASTFARSVKTAGSQ